MGKLNCRAWTFHGSRFSLLPLLALSIGAFLALENLGWGDVRTLCVDWPLRSGRRDSTPLTTRELNNACSEEDFGRYLRPPFPEEVAIAGCRSQQFTIVCSDRAPASAPVADAPPASSGESTPARHVVTIEEVDLSPPSVRRRQGRQEQQGQRGRQTTSTSNPPSSAAQPASTPPSNPVAADSSVNWGDGPQATANAASPPQSATPLAASDSAPGAMALSNRRRQNGDKIYEESINGQVVGYYSGAGCDSTPRPSTCELRGRTEADMAALYTLEARNANPSIPDSPRAPSSENNADAERTLAEQDLTAARQQELTAATAAEAAATRALRTATPETRDEAQRALASARERTIAARASAADSPTRASSRRDAPDDGLDGMANANAIRANLSESNVNNETASQRSSSTDRENATFSREEGTASVAARLRKMGGDDPCATASGIDRAQFGCSGTKALIDAGQMTTTVGQQIGSTVVTAAGQLNQAQAQQEGGTAAMMTAGADTQELGGQTSTVLGTVSAVFGAAQVTAAIGHGSSQAQLRRELNGEALSPGIQKGTAGYQRIREGSSSAESLTAAARHAKDIRESGESASAFHPEESVSDADLQGNAREGGTGYIDHSKVGGLAGRIIQSTDVNKDGSVYSGNHTHSAAIQEAEQQRDQISQQLERSSNDPQKFQALKETHQRAEERVSRLRATRSNEIEARTQSIRRKQSYVGEQLEMAGGEAAAEHGAMAQQAAAAGAMQLATGVAQIVTGQMQAKAARDMRESIKKLSNAETRNDATFSIGDDDLSGGNPFGNGDSPNITGDTDPETSAAEEDEELTDVPGSLGEPTLTKLPEGTIAGAPTGGAFVEAPAKAGAPAGGGAGGAPSAGGTAAATAAASDAGQSKYMAERNRASNRYETGGIGRGLAGGGGNFGGGGSGAIGPDLNAMMEKFLGKKGEEAAGRGILDFGARGGAGQGEQPYSLLDRNANIFDRIHQTYQDKTRRGVIGL